MEIGKIIVFKKNNYMVEVFLLVDLKVDVYFVLWWVVLVDGYVVMGIIFFKLGDMKVMF